MTFQTEPPKPSCPLILTLCLSSILAVGAPLHSMVTLFIQSGHLTQSWSVRASIQTLTSDCLGNQLGVPQILVESA